MIPADGVDTITFDFYGTLARHRGGRGRGAALMAYLRGAGLDPIPWEHQVLYDVFEPHGREYSPELSPEEKRTYRCRLADRVLRRLEVRGEGVDASRHAARIWEILGPGSLAVFPEAPGVLRRLREDGYRTAVVSNWQCGLGHFCQELGLGGLFDHVIASAEVGSAKPDPDIFREACRRLGSPPERILHVGDSPVDDLEGARAAGMSGVLVARNGGAAEGPSIESLTELLEP